MNAYAYVPSPLTWGDPLGACSMYTKRG
ncbi:hypothetical protein SJZ84_20940 [Hafnia paralvei]|nr:hypothetical protein [Hafnia paralvei]MDX6913279.1 hypothetical protein [Hafnia paralvei]